MPETKARNRLILILLWLVVYASAALFTPPLLDDADSVHAEVAREILLRHDWVTLHANGIRYLEKAPVFYWLSAASMAVLGPTTAASRLPLAFAVLALALLLEAFARQASSSARAGLYAGLIFLSSFGIFIFTRINIPDLLVCLFLTAALYAFHQSEAASRPPLTPPLLFAAACALNVLTKGLIGLVFPVGTVLLYLLLTRGLKGTLTRLRQLHPLAALALFLALAAPWHILIAHANPTVGHPGSPTYTAGHWLVPLPTDANVHGWLWFYFANEQLYRYLNLRVPRVNFAGRPEYDTVPLWLFLGLILVWLMPWSAFLPGALREAAVSWRNLRALTPDQRTNLLLLLWTALPLAFFSLSTRQEYYVLPSLPPLILLLARHLSTSGQAVGSRARLDRLPSSSSILLAAGTLLSAATTYFVLRTKAPAPNTDLSTLLQQNPADYALSFGHFLDLNAQALGLFRLPLALTAAAFFLGPLLNFLFRRRANPNAATLSLSAASFLFLAAAWQGLRIFSPTISSYQLAQAIHPRPQDRIILHGEYEDGSTLGFYLQRPGPAGPELQICEGRSSNLWYGSFFPDAPKIFESRTEVERDWSGPQRIFLWQDPHDPDRTPLNLPQPVYLLAQSGGKQILSNQP